MIASTHLTVVIFCLTSFVWLSTFFWIKFKTQHDGQPSPPWDPGHPAHLRSGHVICPSLNESRPSLHLSGCPKSLPSCPKAIRTLILPESPPQPYLQAEPNTFKVMTTIHSGTIKNYLLLTLIPVSINHEKPRTFIHLQSLPTVSDSLLPKALITIQPDIIFF